MKIIKIIVLVVMVLASIPLHAIADHHEDESQASHHCVLVCHTCCHSTIQIQIEMPSVIVISRPVISPSGSSYQNPFLDTFIRPPAVSA